MHASRMAYCVLGEGVVVDPPAHPGASEAAPVQVSPLKFGRMFGRARDLSPAQGKALFDKLVALGLCMNDPERYCGQPAPPDDGESEIPAGYTYLGQFITHEITFDSTGDLLAAGTAFENRRTPQIDLDSLYGGVKGPADKPEIYEDDGVRLKVGETFFDFATPVDISLPYDLPRDKGNQKRPTRALIGDERNDENLPLAQTHLAFIKFHNKVVEKLVEDGHHRDCLFECARTQVIRHFQWIILHDYLPLLVEREVLDSVLRDGLLWFKTDGPEGLFMPLEFSGAAFRIGHSMVRLTYEWNKHRSTRLLDNGVSVNGPVSIIELFQQTAGSGDLGGLKSLASDWVIDWRRFYDFTPLGFPPVQKLNMTSKLDTLLNFQLPPPDDQQEADKRLAEMQRAISVRNLLRGFYLKLPTGEEVAERMGERPLSHEEVAAGPHRELLADPALRGRTPLWYYVLKEAELGGGSRLGRVGSRIVAETLVGLIKNSRHSILDEPGWRPKFGRTDASGEVRFEMIDLLKFAEFIDPIGELELA